MRQSLLTTIIASTWMSAFGILPAHAADPAPPPAPPPAAAGIQVITPNSSAETSDKPKVIPPPIRFSESTVKEYLMIRDPFKEPETQLQKIGQISDLEKYDTTDFKLIAVMTGPKKMRAMIRDVAGKIHTVAVNTRVGKRKGYVRKITTGSVVVREVYPNAIGDDEVYDTEIPLISNKPGGR